MRPKTTRRGRENRGGEAVWPSVCLGSQFGKLKLQKAGRRTKPRVAWEISLSPMVKQENLSHSKGNYMKKTLNDLDAPPVSPPRVLGAPFPVTTESQSGPVYRPSPRSQSIPVCVHNSVRTAKAHFTCRGTERSNRTDGA